MPRPVGMRSSSAVSPALAKARKEIGHKPGSVVYAPLTVPHRTGKVHVVIVDDQDEIHSSMGMALIDAGRDFNSMFAKTPEEELWLYPVHIREVSQLMSVIQKGTPFHWCLFDIKLASGSTKNGLDLLVDARAADDKAFFIIHSTIAEGMEGRQEYHAADLAMTKDASALQRAQLIYQLVAFHPALPTCGACPMYDAVDKKCTAIQSRDPTLRFHPSQLCPWLAQDGLESTLEQLQDSGKQGLALAARIRNVANYLNVSQNAAAVRRMIKRANDESPMVRLPRYPAKQVRERFPMVLRVDDVNPLQIIMLEAAEYPRMRPRLEVTVPPKLQQLYDKLRSL